MPMDFAEFNQRRDAWEATGNRLMTREEVQRFDEFFADPEQATLYKSEGFSRAVVGDFCRFETVEPMMKGYLGAKKCYDLFDRYQGDLTNPKLQQELKERLMEADLRTGLAFGGKDPQDPVSRFMKGCERMANRLMMIQTLQEPDAGAKMRLQDQFTKEDPHTVKQNMDTIRSQDLEQRVEIAKVLFMNHLGKFQTKDTNGQNFDHEEYMAEVYAHGGRTMFILPAGGNQDALIESVKGQHQELSGVNNRYFATHGVEARTLNSDGSIKSEAKELKLNKAQAFSLDKHQGMNASVGGLGQVGPNGHVITADGTNGHMYMHMAPGGKKTCGTLLIGFENSGPGEKGRLGSTHDASAKKAGGSAFLSDKSYLGAERGGRVVDLSGLSAEKLSKMLSDFENGYRQAALAAQAGDTRLLDACNELLTGKQMSVGQMKGMLEGLDVPKQSVQEVEAARMGNPNAPDAKPIDPEQNPAVPMKLGKNQAENPVRITQCPGLEQPVPPKFMKKPGFWDKVANVLSLFSKNSYVNRYKEYQRTLPEKIEVYKRDMADYNKTLSELENGGNPKGLREAYNNAKRAAQEQFGVTKEKVAAPKAPSVAEKHTSPEVAERLETTLVNNLMQGMLPEGTSEQIVENTKNEIRNHIRATESFQKMLRSGDENITSVLNDYDKMNKVLSDVTNSIIGNNGDQRQQSNEAPQKVKEIEQPQAAPRAMGGMGGM